MRIPTDKCRSQARKLDHRAKGDRASQGPSQENQACSSSLARLPLLSSCLLCARPQAECRQWQRWVLVEEERCNILTVGKRGEGAAE